MAGGLFDDDDDDDGRGEDGSRPWKPEKGKRGAGREPDPPNKVAERILAARHVVTDRTGTVYAYDGMAWAPATATMLRSWALEAESAFQSSARRRDEIVAFIKARTVEPDLAWGRVADHEVPCRNGVVDVLTGEVRPHEADDMLERVVPWDYDPGAACPTWIEALDTWFGPLEPEKGRGLIEALQDFFGYICLPHARYKRGAVLHGPSNCGKSVPALTARALVGPAHACQLSVEHMDDPMLRVVLVGKALNVATELTADALIADGGFKTLIATEEPVLINEKFREPYAYVPTAKHLFVCNALPRLTDRSEGVFNRMLIIPFRRVLRDDEQDRDLMAKLMREMPGILAWAVAGARRLVARGGTWVVPEASQAAMAAYREEWNPAIAFVRECCEAVELRDGKMVSAPLSQLTKEFNRWSDEPRKVSTKALAKRLRAAGYAVKVVRQGRQVVASLLGYRYVGAAPTPSLVWARDAVSEADEIEAAGQADPPDPV